MNKEQMLLLLKCIDYLNDHPNYKNLRALCINELNDMEDEATVEVDKLREAAAKVEEEERIANRAAMKEAIEASDEDRADANAEANRRAARMSTGQPYQPTPRPTPPSPPTPPYTPTERRT